MPGMADMVSANTRAGSRPETKVSVQTTLATKPVATFGTSRARAAVSASALSAAVLARMRMRFRRFTGASGMTHQRVPGIMASAAMRLAGFGNRPCRKLERGSPIPKFIQ